MMDALAVALPLVKQFEGCRLESYQDIVGVWTIGYGETLDVGPGMVWTQAQADQRLYTRLQTFMARVVGACPPLALPGASNRLAACTSLGYNIGVTAFGASTVCRMIKAGNLPAAADAFLLWNKAGGQVVEGLNNRRKGERVVFVTVPS